MSASHFFFSPQQNPALSSCEVNFVSVKLVLAYYNAAMLQCAFSCCDEVLACYCAGLLRLTSQQVTDSNNRRSSLSPSESQWIQRSGSTREVEHCSGECEWIVPKLV